jgi:Class III cytochrome C family/Cytochrome c7 and related cytochrome c
MRMSRRLLVVSLGIVALPAAYGAVFLVRQSSGTVSPPAPESGVYTPVHRSMLDAIEDYFDYRPTRVQPVAFTHKAHLAIGLKCENCHTGVDTGPDAAIPNVELCMTCHAAIDANNPEIKKIAAYKARGEEIPWQPVYAYRPSAHVKFYHGPHIHAGIGCDTCHGDMRQQTVARRVVNMDMAFCLDCHKQRNVSVDCNTCHF